MAFVYTRYACIVHTKRVVKSLNLRTPMVFLRCFRYYTTLVSLYRIGADSRFISGSPHTPPIRLFGGCMSFHLLPSQSVQVSARGASEVKCARQIGCASGMMLQWASRNRSVFQNDPQIPVRLQFWRLFAESVC